MLDRLSEFRVMWLLVLFDLPTDTKQNRREAALFRKLLLGDGFQMFQFSIYLRHCPSKENAKVHIQRVKNNIPKYGKIGILCITDKQFASMELFYGKNPAEKKLEPIQLELF